jgi:hypothetical protein
MTATVSRLIKGLVLTFLWVLGLFTLVQFIPYGRGHSNPPVIDEPHWDTPRTRALAVRACFGCHSNETRWPWYADVAPFSWVVQQDVASARTVVNFSEWNRPYELASYSGLSITGGSMPPAKYRMAHPEADLTDAEQLELAHGLDATLKPGH